MSHPGRYPQYALLGSLGIYPAIFWAILPAHAPFHRIAQSREALSLVHVTVQTLLSAACLLQQRDALATPTRSEKSPTSINLEPPIIATRSVFAQCITAIEAGYLVQDSLVLLLAHRRQSKASTNRPRLKSWNLLHLGIHHAILGGLLLLLQYHIAGDREKGILVIIILHLMNASSIPGTVRWFLINFRPGSRRLIAITTAAYLSSFAFFRVYVVLWAMRIYGEQRGPSILLAVKSLPMACRLGTGSILTINIIWLIAGIRNNLVRRIKD